MKQNSRNEVSEFIYAERISQNNIKEVLQIAKLEINRYELLSFLRMILVWVGAISLVMALLFFMAFNWQELGRFTKFLMLESVMLTLGIIYLFLDKFKRLQQVLLTVESITLGVFLALIGQTYQTGADPWQLFAFWALFMTPWAIIANFSGLWLFWIVLFNLASLLYFQKFDLSVFSFFEMHDSLLLLTFMVNTFLWLLWEFLSQKYTSFKSKISINFLAFISMASMSTLVIFNLLETVSEMNKLYFLIYMGFLGMVYYLYKIKTLNIYMMSLFALSILFVSISVFIRFLADYFDDFFAMASLLLLFIILIITQIIGWLKQLKEER